MTEPTSNSTSQDKPVKGKKSYWRRILCGTSAVFFVLVFSLLVLLANDQAQSELIRFVDKQVDGLQIEQVEGGLQQGLLLRNVQFKTDGVEVELAQARVQLDWHCLLKLRICLQDLSLQQPDIRLDTSHSAPSDADNGNGSGSELGRLFLPVSIQVDNLDLQDVRVQNDQDVIALKHLHSAASLNNQQGLTLAPTEIDQLSVQWQSKPEAENPTEKKSAEENPAEISAPETESAPIDWVAVEHALSEPLLASLQKIDLPFDFHIQGIHGKNWRYQSVGEAPQTVEIPTLELQADATGYLLQLQKFVVASSVGNAQISGQIELEQDFPTQLDVDADWIDFSDPLDNRIVLPASQIHLQLDGKLKKTTALTLQGKGAITGQLWLNAQLAEPKTPLELKIDMPQGRYEFFAQDPLKVRQAKLELSGDLINYRLHLTGEASGMGIPTSWVDLTGTGTPADAQVSKLLLRGLDGTANLQGKLDWHEGFAWDSLGQFDKVNVGKYLAELPAVLSGDVHSKGKIDSKTWLLETPHVDLSGTLSQHPVSLKGAFDVGERLLNAQNLVLHYGANQIVAQGKISEQSDFSLALNAPNLKGLWSDLSASLNGNLKLQGKFTAPVFDVDLNIPQFHYQQLNLSQTKITGRLDASQEVQGHLDLALGQFTYGDMLRLTQAKLSLKGNEKQHSLNLSSEGEPIGAKLNVTGSFNRTSQHWQGTISNVSIHSPVGNWQNDKAITLDYDHHTLLTNIASHCWHNPDVSVCFPQNFVAGQTGKIPFEIKKFDLALVNKLIKQETFNGQLHSQGSLEWFADKPVQFDMNVEGNNLSIAQKLDYRTLKLAIAKLNLDAHLQNDNLALKSELALPEQGKLSADIKLQNLADNRQLAGHLSLQKLKLNLANQLLKEGEKIDGELVADLKLGGDLTAPTLTGQLAAKQISSKIQSLPFDLKNGDITLSFAGQSSKLQGFLQTEDSRLNIDGDASWSALDDWRARAKIHGEQFKVDIPSMAKLKISPNVEIRSTPKLLELMGEIDIPWARVEIDKLPDSAAEVSKDEVIVDGKRHPLKAQKTAAQIKAETRSGMKIHSDLRIKIGEDVSLNAYGLKTNLEGLLVVKQENDALGLYGQVDLKKGRYAAFGQDLLISKGAISFSGIPSQPMISIEAIRNPDAMEDSTITAGVKVLGIATQPQISVFSTPSMPQDQALSYLLTGRGMDSNGDASAGGSVGAALLGLGLAKSGKLVGGIGEAFGIQDLNLGTQGAGDNSKVVVSGNITPRLQVKYGVGLFDGLAEFTVRYRLMPRLYLQSVTSVAQAVDLLYRFEF